MDPSKQNNNNSKRLLEYFSEFVWSLLDKKAVSTTKVAAAAIITQNMIDIVENKEVWGDPRKNSRNTTTGGNPIAIFF